MRTQIRPRVLIPAIALVVVVGAAAAWKLTSSDGDATPASATPEAGGTPLPGVADAGSAGVATPDGWIGQANAICAAELSGASTGTELPAEPAIGIANALESRRATVAQLRAVEAPAGHAGELDQLVAVLDRQVTTAADAVTAFEAGKQKQAKRMLAEVAALEKQSDELATTLGLAQCADDPANGIDAGVTIGELKLAKAFADHRVVVLVLYTSRADLDAAVLREARAAATSAGASFVALDGTKQRDGGAVAEAAGLRATPSTVVFTPGGDVVAEIPGFADRETVAQAVANARASAATSS